MIAHLRGILVEKLPRQIIVDVAGVGYDVNVPFSTSAELPELGVEVRLRIHTTVEDDEIRLFGFGTADAKNMFKHLISVSGIGTDMGIEIMSALATHDLVSALRQGQTEKLARIPGIGKKLAERLAAELRGKLPGPSEAPVHASIHPAEPTLSPLESDVLSALHNLGSDRTEARNALLEIKNKTKANGAPLDFASLFRATLKILRPYC